MLLSGILVACGLVLGAFTLHGYFDPHWLQNQLVAASTRERSARPETINAFHGRSRFVRSRGKAARRAEGEGRPQKVLVTHGNGKAGVKAARTTTGAVTTKAPAKARPKRKAAAEQRTAPKQAALQWPVLQWPWKLFGN
jgi:hypothetical protein